MANNRKPYYVSSYSLTSYLQSQRSVSHRYNPKSYFGSCMRIQEQQMAKFLSDFVNDIAIILPEHYDLMANILFITQYSKYKPIKKLLPLAAKKFKAMDRELNNRMNAAMLIAPINKNAHGAAKYAVLDNKKKMLLMSCSNLCFLGDAINNERDFNTTTLKNKFASFVSYRIELVLSGKMPIDPDFKMLIKTYGTSQQNKRYTNLISNNSVRKVQPGKQVQPIPQQTKTTDQRNKKSVKPVADTKTPQKKSGIGFFNKLKQSVKTIVTKVKKPLLFGGIFLLSFVSGKEARDAALEQNEIATQTESTVNNTPKQQTTPVLNLADAASKTNTTNSNVQPQSTKVLNKTIKRLQHLKEINPTDKNMDVNQTANRLYKQFGEMTSDVVLASSMSPYALNDCVNFDFCPTTHNMIEYLSTHELTSEQKKALTQFIAQHVKNNSINTANFSQKQR